MCNAHHWVIFTLSVFLAVFNVAIDLEILGAKMLSDLLHLTICNMC